MPGAVQRAHEVQRGGCILWLLPEGHRHGRHPPRLASPAESPPRGSPVHTHSTPGLPYMRTLSRVSASENTPVLCAPVHAYSKPGLLFLKTHLFCVRCAAGGHQVVQVVHPAAGAVGHAARGHRVRALPHRRVPGGGGGGELVPCSAPLAARLGGWASSLCSIFALCVAGVKACLAGLLAEACMPTVPSNLL